MDRVIFAVWLMFRAILITITCVGCIIWVAWLVTPPVNAESEIQQFQESRFRRGIPIDRTRYRGITIKNYQVLETDLVGCRACRIENWKTHAPQQRMSERTIRTQQTYEKYFRHIK